MLPHQLRHLDDMSDNGPHPFKPEQPKVREGSEDPGAGSGGLQRIHTGAIVAEVVEIRHLFRVAFHSIQIRLILEEDKAGDIGNEPGFMEVDADGIREG